MSVEEWELDEGLSDSMRQTFREFLRFNGLPIDEDEEGFVVEGVEFGITCDAEAGQFMNEHARSMIDYPGSEE